MTQFASDAFTGTSGTTLATYSANWTEHGSYASGDVCITDANRARSNSANATAYYHSGSPPSADYSVSADLYAASASGPATGITGRMDTGANTFYMARFFSSDGGWQLHRFVGGTVTQLGSTVTQTLTAGNSYNVKLEMIGNVIKLFKEGSGTASISYTDSTPISPAGKSGLRCASGTAPTNTTGLHYDNFSADDLSTGANIAKAINEASQIADAIARALILNRPQAETVQGQETAATSRDLRRLLADAVQSVEAAATSIGLCRLLADAVQVAETAVMSLAAEVIKVLSEAVQGIESLARATTLFKIMSETLTTIEALAVGRWLNRAASETVAMTETLSLSRALARLIGETMRISEATARWISGALDLLAEVFFADRRDSRCLASDITTTRVLHGTVLVQPA